MAGTGLAGGVAHDVGTLAPATAVSIVWISASCTDTSMWSPDAIHGPVPQRHERQIGGHRRGNLERRLTRRQERLSTRKPAELQLPRERVHHRVGNGEVVIRPGGPERRERHHDQVGELPPHGANVEPAPTRIEPDVSVAEQRTETLRVVEHHRSLIGVSRRGQRIETPGSALDPDHIGAEISEQPSRSKPRPVGRVHNPQPLQRQIERLGLCHGP